MNSIMRTQRVGVVLGGVAVIGGVLLAACSSDPVTVDPVASVQKSGNTDNQQIAAGTVVTRSPEVTLTLASGALAVGETVTFAVESGGGSVTGAVATTDIRGKAVVRTWTLGPIAGANTLSATSANGIKVTFTAIGIPGPAATMVIGEGDEQSARIGTEVPVRPGVLVTDQFGNGVQGVTVVFTPLGDSQVIGNPSVISEPDGMARAGGWQMGSTPGEQLLEAAATGFTPLTFSATATP